MFPNLALVVVRPPYSRMCAGCMLLYVTCVLCHRCFICLWAWPCHLTNASEACCRHKANNDDARFNNRSVAVQCFKRHSTRVAPAAQRGAANVARSAPVATATQRACGRHRAHSLLRYATSPRQLCHGQLGLRTRAHRQPQRAQLQLELWRFAAPRS